MCSGGARQHSLAWGGRKNAVLKPQVRFSEPSVLDFASGYMGCLAVQGPGAICRVTAKLHGCWIFPFCGHQQVHVLGGGTSGRSSLEAGALRFP